MTELYDRLQCGTRAMGTCSSPTSGPAPPEWSAFREVDLQSKYHRAPKKLADALGLTAPKAMALRRHLSIDSDETCTHVFEFGSQRRTMYFDNAYRRMKEALKTVDMAEVWEKHKLRRRPKA